ncbi:hypothetical protein KA005_39595 [bacterium]|nr:hypothetical protein [bacterium]
MLLKDFLNSVIEMAELDPTILELQLVTSVDDEGNGFNPVHYEPTLGYYNAEDREFNQEDPHPNAICLN